MPYKDPIVRAAYHSAYSKTWSEAHPERRAAACRKWRTNGGNEQMKATKKALRLEVLAHYGGQCECCGETIYEFLSFDHIGGGGKEHRRELNGTHIEAWLKKNNYPKGFRVLCHCCNLAIGFYGYCPHEREQLGDT